jgi:hypothetical protein
MRFWWREGEGNMLGGSDYILLSDARSVVRAVAGEYLSASLAGRFLMPWSVFKCHFTYTASPFSLTNSE